MSNFTPGPWILEWSDAPVVDVLSGPVRICRVDTDEINAGLGAQEGQANARLIAEAPELYKLMQLLLDTGEDNSMYLFYRAKARASLARIDGTEVRSSVA